MSAPLAGKFQDHYQVLGIDADSSSETIQSAYTYMVGRFHPGKGETPDKERYDAIVQAFEVLADPTARKTFDSVRSGPERETFAAFSGQSFFDELAKEGIRRQCILCLLYDRRRIRPASPGLSFRLVETMMNCTADEIQLAIWYLRQRGLVLCDDKSNLQINVGGMEHLEKNPPSPDEMLALLRSNEDVKVRMDAAKAKTDASQAAQQAAQQAAHHAKQAEAKPAPARSALAFHLPKKVVTPRG